MKQRMAELYSTIFDENDPKPLGCGWSDHMPLLRRSGKATKGLPIRWYSLRHVQTRAVHISSPGYDPAELDISPASFLAPALGLPRALRDLDEKPVSA